MKRFLFVSFLFILSPLLLQAQDIGLKTNTLYMATSTPNLGLEFQTGLRTSLSISGGYNPFNFPSYVNSSEETIYPRFRHWVVMPEFKYWFCRSFERSYIGLHGLYGAYNMGGIRFLKFLADYRYKGYVYGGGLSWGYQWAFGDRFGLEMSLGAGYLQFHYDKYECKECGESLGTFDRSYFGPTKAALSIIYYLR